VQVSDRSATSDQQPEAEDVQGLVSNMP